MKSYLVFFGIIMLCLCCGGVSALMVYQSDEELIRASDEIVYGKIIDVHSQWNAAGTQIETTADILVADAFKGSDPAAGTGKTVPVTVIGGTVGETTQWVEDMPVFLPGTDAFVYLGKRSDGRYSVKGLDNGVHVAVNGFMTKTGSMAKAAGAADDVKAFKQKIATVLDGSYVKTYDSGASTALAGTAGKSGPTVRSATITTVSPTAGPAGTSFYVTIKGSGFGTKASRDSMADVAFLYKTPGSYIYASGWPYFSDNANDIISWSNTQIKARVPSGYVNGGYPGGASSGWIEILTDASAESNAIPFTVTNSYGKKKWGGPATFKVNPGGVAGSATAINNAAASWNKALWQSPFRINYGGTSTSTVFGQNGQSLIYFGPEADFSPNEDLIIAWASSWSSGGIISEADIEFNKHWTWTTGTASGTTMNTEAIVLHEQGHWLFLKDLYGYLPEYDPTLYAGWPSDLSPEKKVMFGINGDSLGNKNLKVLSAADAAGARWIYPSTMEKIGYFRAGAWRVDSNGNYTYEAVTDENRVFGATGFTPVLGDWNGDGRKKIGYFNAGTWRLDYNGDYLYSTANDKQFIYGQTGDKPVVGDWNGDGRDEIGYFRDGVWRIDYDGNFVYAAGTDKQVTWGAAGYTPVVGDWNNNGKDKIGYFRNGVWRIDYDGNFVYAAGTDKQVTWGTTGDKPVVGDWNNNNKDKIGYFRNGVWRIDYDGNFVYAAASDKQVTWGTTGDKPVVGDWNGNGKDKIGYFRNGVWRIDYNGNFAYATATDKQVTFGQAGDTPLVGNY